MSGNSRLTKDAQVGRLERPTAGGSVNDQTPGRGPGDELPGRLENPTPGEPGHLHGDGGASTGER